MTTFTPSTWRKAGEQTRQAADELYERAYGVITARALQASTSSPIEAAAVAGDAQCNVPWHQLIAAAQEGLTSTSSKMFATGDDYAATEEAAASQRFWE